MDRDGRVFMIVRASSPRGANNGSINGNGTGGGGGGGGVLMTGGGAGGGANGADMLGLNMAAMEADWRQQQFQRQRMQLLSMAIFLCFMVLFFDNRAGNDVQRRQRMEGGGGAGGGHMGNGANGYNRYAMPHEMFNDTERLIKVHELEGVLETQPGYMKDKPPMNVSGIYSGTWESLAPEDYDAQKPVYTDIIPYLKVDREIQLQQYTQPVEAGHTWLFLKMKVPASKELKKDVAYVTGQLVIYEEQASLAATILPVQGVFLRKLGKLTLFGNSPDASVQLLYRKNKLDASNGTISSPPIASDSSLESDLEFLDDQPALASGHATLDPRLDILNFGVIDGVPVLENKDDYVAVDVSPPRYAYVSRFRSSDSFSDQCVSIVEMSLVNGTTGAPKTDLTEEEEEEEFGDEQLAKALRNMQLTGTLASVNCGLYLKIDTTFQEENLNVFFSKASRYAVLMTLIAMGEIYFLLRQLQISNTQATAAKVSLLTIGQQAIVDSYLCLGHLTVGIVAQNVFAAFASVAFVKLIIFSVFEMRYLLIIWKARRPQGFSEGWLTLRRELTTLYSRFYLSLLAGLCIFYNFSNHLPVLVFICYSFWVPQIVHNVHREVRNPFDLGYLYGISALRLFLPLYFYGCPSNFLTAFPMYESKPNPRLCYILILWMAFQVSVLTLQQRYGPRFFVPARFLPVKYNYERRINLQEMTLLRSSDEDNSIDCVICMVELDIDARDYMLAPCEHIFHRECLQGWMQVKMECPTCRCVLPEP